MYAHQEIITHIENVQVHESGMELDQVTQYEIGVGESTIWRGKSAIDLSQWISVKKLVLILIRMIIYVLSILLHVAGIIHIRKLIRRDWVITMMLILRNCQCLKRCHLIVVNIL